MSYVWAALLLLLNLVWLATVVAGLPGTWLMGVSTALLAWLYWGDPETGEAGMFSLATLIAIVALATVAEIAEFVTGVVGAKKAGGTRWGAVGAIVKGIQSADLGLNPSDDGELIRVPIPALTEERRHELVRQCKKMGEDVKVSIRNIRRDANEELERAQKGKEISEDDLHRGQKEVQKVTDRQIEEVDEALRAKEQEILEV